MKRGNWIVLGIILLGLLGSAAAVGYRALIVARSKPAAPAAPPIKAKWDRDAAGEQLMLLQEQYLKSGEGVDLPAIMAAAQKIIRQYPKFAQAYTLLAQVYIDADEYEQAREALEQSLDLDGRQAEVHLMAGNLAMMADDIDAAESHFKTAITLNPDEARYLLHLANVYFEQGRIDQARYLYLDALRRDSSLHQGYGGLADIYASLNRLQLALTNIQKAIDHTTGEGRRGAWRAYIRKKAALLRRDNRPDESLMTLEVLSVHERLDPDILEEQAISWAMLGKPGNSATLYEEALAANPVHWRYAAGAAKWRIKSGNLDIAKRHLRLLRKLDPNLPVIEKLEKQIEQR